MFTIALARPEDRPAIERLLDLSFGPGRFAKTAERLREGAPAIEGLSFCAFLEEPGKPMAGSIRFTPLLIGEAEALLLGPLAVDPALRGQGVGLALMEKGLEAAAALGHRLVILIGDEPYYARAGFSKVPPGKMTMPGPVDPARLLYRELVPGAAAKAEGAIRPAP